MELETVATFTSSIVRNRQLQEVPSDLPREAWPVATHRRRQGEGEMMETDGLYGESGSCCC